MSDKSANASEDLDSCLPQFQCRRCGYDDCASYARALRSGQADINRCEPGGSQVIRALSKRLNAPVRQPADDTVAGPSPWTTIADIDPLQCIGCTKCLPVCPMDAIIGSAKKLHRVLDAYCTGCGLCLAPCPVDCINLIPNKVVADNFNTMGIEEKAQIQKREEADLASLLASRYERHKSRLKNNKHLHKKRLESADEQEISRRRTEILASVARVRNRRNS